MAADGRQPGVVDPAGYDLITGVQSIEGGKTAVVTFSQPYPAWRELFNDILPAHIVKDVPGGFAAGLARAMPVTGGQFRVDNIDPQRDEILLARNDRYWGVPAKPDQILFRRGGSARRAGRFDPQRRHPGGPGARRPGGLRAVGGHPRRAHGTDRDAARHAVDAEGATARRSSDARVRKGILGLLDVDLLAAVGAGSDNTVTLAQAQVRSPSDPGYVPTAPPAIPREEALDLLSDAGYEIEPVAGAARRHPSPVRRLPTTPAAASARTASR